MSAEAVEPKSLDEYNTKFQKNQRFSGAFLETMFHLPCPGCAEPDWLSYRIIDVEHAMAKETECKHCGRAFKCLFAKSQNGVSFEIVQTRGPDLAIFLPRIRRL